MGDTERADTGTEKFRSRASAALLRNSADDKVLHSCPESERERESPIKKGDNKSSERIETENTKLTGSLEKMLENNGHITSTDDSYREWHSEDTLVTSGYRV